MSIGANIKTARKSKGLTQAELGERMGVTAQMVALYETDKRNPKRETVKRIAEALNIPSHILEREDDITPNDIELANIETETILKFKSVAESAVLQTMTHMLEMLKDCETDDEYAGMVEASCEYIDRLIGLRKEKNND